MVSVTPLTTLFSSCKCFWESSSRRPYIFNSSVQAVGLVPTPREAKVQHGTHLSYLLGGYERSTRWKESEITLLPFLCFPLSLRHCGQCTSIAMGASISLILATCFPLELRFLHTAQVFFFPCKIWVFSYICTHRHKTLWPWKYLFWTLCHFWIFLNPFLAKNAENLPFWDLGKITMRKSLLQAQDFLIFFLRKHQIPSMTKAHFLP